MSKVYWVGVVKWNDGTFYTTEPFYEYDEGIKVWSTEFSSKHQGEFEYIDYERFDGVVRDLEYWKKNAEEDYITTPISVLRYISELEKEVERSYSGKDLKRAHWNGWVQRERLDDMVPELDYPPGLDYEEKEEYTFNEFLKGLK